MSADNYVAIVKEKNGKYRGYDLSASADYNGLKDIRKQHHFFEVTSIKKAIKKAQGWGSEYGYHFMNL